MKFVGLLLAAGSATRFGSDKLQHPLPHGVVIAVQSARHLLKEIPRVVAAVRPDNKDIARALEAEGCEVVVCARAAEGMGASLACAARAAGEADGYLVALADMPFVRPSTIAAVRDALERGALLAAPFWRARRGHPVGFAGRLRGALEASSGDEGARRVLEAHAAELVKVPVGDPGALRDIDKPADLAPPLAV
ncbi:MAG: nucleotidyltransferase family protein [Betaproteobacteria bacterium]|nr:nucleotidyltransferase family protein [Betaproteobacteria bacterium]